MKKIFFLALTALTFCVPASAGEDPFAVTHKSLKDQAFVIETDEESAAESLNRVSGKIDLGFTTPDQEYEASDQYHPGPFGQQDSKDNYSQSY